MKATPECIVCTYRQALNTARLVTEDSDQQLRILADVACKMRNADLGRPPAELSKAAYEAVSRVTGVNDPYSRQKGECNQTAMMLVPGLRSLIASSPDPLRTALMVAAAGNIIDLGIGQKFDIARDVSRIVGVKLAIDACGEFRAGLSPGRKLLYLGDNAGEIVCDRLLVERLIETGIKVVFVVKSGPIINDASMEDARATGMTDIVEVIETGSDDIGVNWNNCSREFVKQFESADVILAKGHGNFETCDNRPENVYFLLKAKCGVVAAQLGVKTGDLVFTRGFRR